MTESLIDTDILSYYFKGDPAVIAKFNDYLKAYEGINISIITYYEIVAGLKFRKAVKQLKDFEEFVKYNTILFITEKSAKIAGDIYAELRRKGIVIGMPDILIAGIAIENDLTLITNNERHYHRISKLKCENWKKLP